jgi:hypothetical protein
MPEIRDLLMTQYPTDQSPATATFDNVLARFQRRRRVQRVRGTALVVVAALAIAVPFMRPVSHSGPPDTGPRPGHSTGVTSIPVASEIDCGTFVAKGPTDSGLPHSAWTCFTDALTSGHAARLAVTLTSTDGDPVAHLYETRGDGVATVTTDARGDKFAGVGKDYQTETCRGVDPAHDRMFLSCASPSFGSPPAQ